MTTAQELREIIYNAEWSVKEAARRLHTTRVTIHRYIAQAQSDNGEDTATEAKRQPPKHLVEYARLLSRGAK